MKLPWKRKKLASAGSWLLAMSLFFACLEANGQTSPFVTVTGVLGTASGTPAANATLTLTPSQVFFISNTSVVVSASQCATDNLGNVVGIGNPLQPPRASTQLTGSLPPGNYYMVFGWYNLAGQVTLASPEIVKQLSGTGELQILPPAGTGPPTAAGMRVYIGTSPGQESLQGTTSSTTAQYTQATALTSGAALPTMNTTVCQIYANDAGWPTGTGYQASLVDQSGNTLFSYPELWQFFGPGSTYNLSNGIPYYHGQVTYPTPILSAPYNHNPQSISGPLSLTGYNLYSVGEIGVGTALPAWGIDVEGTGLAADINAAGGYLVNGNGGSLGQCLGSDGTTYDTPINCVTSLPTLFYQTVLNGPATSNAVTQRSYLAVGAGTGLIATDVPAGGGDPSRTVVSANASASLNTDPYLVPTSLTSGGVSGNCASWDSAGGVGDSGHVCGLPILASFSFTSCSLAADGGSVWDCTGTATIGSTLSNTTYKPNCTLGDGTAGYSSIGPTAIFIQTRTTTNFTYALSATHSGANGSSFPVYCVITP